jgi:hypothetical protein
MSMNDRYSPEFVRFLDEEIARLSAVKPKKPKKPSAAPRFVQGKSVSLDGDNAVEEE